LNSGEPSRMVESAARGGGTAGRALEDFARHPGQPGGTGADGIMRNVATPGRKGRTMASEEPASTERGAEGLNGRGPLHSLLNGVDVLGAFSVTEPLLGVNEIARRVRLHKSTVSRILSTLEQVDLVERDEVSGRFRLGIGVIGLAGPLLANLDVRRVAYTALAKLVELTG